MGRVQFDFREGLDQEKIIYRNKSVDCKSFMYYIGYLLLTWLYAAGWFALFQYAYINHEPIAFWVYIACWLIFIITVISILGYNLVHSHNLKMEKKRLSKIEEENRAAREAKEREERQSKKVAVTHKENLYLQTHNEKDRLNAE